MADRSPLEDLLERLRAALLQGPGEAAIPLVRNLLEPFQLVPKAQFEQQQTALAQAEALLATLEQRVLQLEAQAAKKKRKKQAAKARSKTEAKPQDSN